MSGEARRLAFRIALAALLLAALRLRAAEPPAPAFELRERALAVISLPPILGRPEVRPHLSTGLTTTFAVEVSAVDAQGHRARGGGRIDVRYELWDEVFLVSATGADGRAHRESLPSFDRLLGWWRGLVLPVLVLLVEDDPKIRASLALQLGEAGLAVEALSSEEEAYARLSDRGRLPPDLLLLDIRLGGMSGVELLKILSSEGRPIPPTIVISGEASISETVEALRLGVHDFIEKPRFPASGSCARSRTPWRPRRGRAGTSRPRRGSWASRGHICTRRWRPWDWSGRSGGRTEGISIGRPQERTTEDSMPVKIHGLTHVALSQEVRSSICP